MATFTCSVCGKEKQVKRKDLWHSKYCSHHCSGIGSGINRSVLAKERRVKKHCIVCGNEILVRPSHAKTEGTYCSKTCQAKDYQTRLLGDNNPKWKGGITYDASEYQKKLRKEKPEIYGKYSAKYFKRHPEVRRENYRKYRANRKAVEEFGHFTEKEWNELLDRLGHKCLCCGKTDIILTRDHVIPLKPGTDTIDNIQPLCARCNSSKGRKTIDYRPVSYAEEAMEIFDWYMEAQA